MKKSILTLLLISSIFTSAYSQKEVNGCLVTMKAISNDRFEIKNDSITATIFPSEFFWEVKILNKLKSDISVVWEKSAFIVDGKSSKIIFDDTSRLLKNNVIQDQQVPSEAYIIKKIFPADNLAPTFIYPTVHRRNIQSRFKKTGIPDNRKIIIAIKTGEDIKNYVFDFEVIPKSK